MDQRPSRPPLYCLILRAIFFCPVAVCLLANPFAAPPIMKIPLTPPPRRPSAVPPCGCKFHPLYPSASMALIALALEEAQSGTTPLLAAGLLLE